MRALRAAVLGSPISHSKSPLLHAAAYRLLGRSISYGAIEMDEAGLPGLMRQIRTEDDWAGLSVTMPLKAAMADLVDELDGPAAALGVVNTVTFDGPPAAPLRGHNTDVAGIVQALRAAEAGRPDRVTVLGGGGTALAATAAAAELGTAHLDVVVRTPAKAAEIAALAARIGLASTVRPWSEAVDALGAADVVVCTLPPRGADSLAAELDAAGDALPSLAGRTLLDVAYDPWPSELAQVWVRQGGTIVPGLDMLLYQGLEQVRLFTGEALAEPDGVINAMYEAVGAPRREVSS